MSEETRPQQETEPAQGSAPTQEPEPYREWDIITVDTRRFSVWVDVAWKPARVPRLRLVANTMGQVRLRITAPYREAAGLLRRLEDGGYRTPMVSMTTLSANNTWRKYLNELEAAHICLEYLGWRLTPREQRMIDAIDDYGRKRPPGLRAPHLQ